MRAFPTVSTIHSLTDSSPHGINTYWRPMQNPFVPGFCVERPAIDSPWTCNVRGNQTPNTNAGLPLNFYFKKTEISKQPQDQYNSKPALIYQDSPKDIFCTKLPSWGVEEEIKACCHLFNLNKTQTQPLPSKVKSLFSLTYCINSNQLACKDQPYLSGIHPYWDYLLSFSHDL
jgi:hypothetical protein